MSTASRQVRKTRRIKRNAILAHRQLRTLYGSYEQLRAFAQGLKAELDLRDKAAEAPIVKEPLVTIKRIPEDEPEIAVAEPNPIYDLKQEPNGRV